MHFTTKFSVVLNSGNRRITLDREDCANLLNAMIRNNLLEIDIENMPERYESMLVHAEYAGDGDADSGDDRVYLHIDCNSGFICACPRAQYRTPLGPNADGSQPAALPASDEEDGDD